MACNVGMEKTHFLDSPGIRAKIMAALGVSAQVVSNWKARDMVPIEHCAAIEIATDGAVTRQELRPDDWRSIWPELADKAAA